MRADLRVFQILYRILWFCRGLISGLHHFLGSAEAEVSLSPSIDLVVPSQGTHLRAASVARARRSCVSSRLFSLSLHFADLNRLPFRRRSSCAADLQEAAARFMESVRHSVHVRGRCSATSPFDNAPLRKDSHRKTCV